MSGLSVGQGPPGAKSEDPRIREDARAEIATGGTDSESGSAPSGDGWKVPLVAGAALEWARRGYPVFPCRNLPGSDGHKAPLTCNGFHNATTDEATIKGWWQGHPDALIGVPTGSATGLAVLDLDKKNNKDGYAAVPDWETLTPAIVRTGSGGAHLYFAADGQVRCATGKDGVDVRGDGGYVIVPPSQGYTWHREADLSALPPFPLAFRPREYTAMPADELAAEDPAEVAAALRAIPNDDEDHDRWLRIGLATFSATAGSDEGLDAWQEWSAKSTKYDAHYTAQRWEKIHSSPPTSIGAGTIFWEAEAFDPGWRSRHWRQVEAELEAQLNGGAADFLSGMGLEPSKVVEEAHPAPAAGEAPAGDEQHPSTPDEAEPGTPSATDEESKPAPRPTSALGEWNAGSEDWSSLPPRKWLLGNVFCRRFVSSLIADGGIGKTALRILQALSLATNKQLTGEHVFQRARVLYVSLEDDRDELRRRVRAAMLHHKIEPAEIDGWLFLSAPEGKAGKLVTANPRTKRPLIADMKPELDKAISANAIDLLILDPLVKAHDVEENDNSAMDVVIQVLANLAVAHDIAVDVLHHTSKGAADPGNADRGRGASAVKNGARLVYTLTQMSVDEAKLFGVNEAERRSHVRVDSGKVNITPPLERAQWFQIVGVPLGNAEALYPNGDRVQTMVPWTPPQVWDGISDDVLKRIVDEIDAGVPGAGDKGILEGGRYSDAPKATTRAAWQVVARHTPGKTEKQCRQFIAELVKQKRLVAKDYRDPNDRRMVKGLYLLNLQDLEDDPM